jgi:transketolase
MAGGMRSQFTALLHAEMERNNKIVVITADLGFGVLDSIRDDFPDRFFNVGAAEVLMLGMAVGFAHAGMLPVCYSISSFLIARPFELIRNYLNYGGANVKLVGSGRSKDYAYNGLSHWAHDHDAIMAALPNIDFFKPNVLDSDTFNAFMYAHSPGYLNLSR